MSYLYCNGLPSFFSVLPLNYSMSPVDSLAWHHLEYSFFCYVFNYMWQPNMSVVKSWWYQNIPVSARGSNRRLLPKEINSWSHVWWVSGVCRNTHNHVTAICFPEAAALKSFSTMHSITLCSTSTRCLELLCSGPSCCFHRTFMVFWLYGNVIVN